MKKALVSLFTLALVLISAPVFSDDIDLAKKSTLEQVLQRGELRIGVDPGYMPFVMTDKKGEYVGFEIDMAREMSKAMKVDYKIISTAWDGIIPALLTGKFDIIICGMTSTQERNLKVNFSDAYLIVGQTILLNKKHADTIKSYKDLNDPKYTVTSKLGTTGEQAIKQMIPKANYKSFEDVNEAALEVVNNRADAFVYDLPTCATFFAQQGEGRVIFLDKPFTQEPLAWALRKGDPDFMFWLNTFLKQIKLDGRYDRMYNKWFKSTRWIEQVQQ